MVCETYLFTWNGSLNFKLFSCSRLNHVAAGLVSPSLKSDTSSKEIEEAMKRVREAQSLISAAIEPGKMLIHMLNFSSW